MWLEHFFNPPFVSQADIMDRQDLLTELYYSPDNMYVMYQLAYTASDYADIKTVLKYADQCLAVEGKYYTKEDIYFLYGRVELTKRNYKKALEWYLKSEHFDHPELDSLYCEIGGTYAYMGKYEEAEKYLLKAIECYESYYPNQANHNRRSMGRLLLEVNRAEEALTHFQMYLKYVPDDWYTILSIGICYYKLEDDLRAIGNVYKALKINPLESSIYNTLGAVVHNTQGNIPEAIEHMEKSLKLAEADNQLKFAIYNNLQILYSAISDVEKANHYKERMMQFMGLSAELLDPNREGNGNGRGLLN